MSHIFISHVEEDKAIALDVARGLEAAGYTTWYYERDSFPGPSYLLAVKEAIEKSRAVVLIVSPKAIASHQMGIEFDRAFEIRQPFVPLLRGLNHVEFQHRQPKWAFALGTTTTIVVPAAGALPIVPNITAGLKKLGILPLKQPTKVRLWDPVAAVGDVIKKRKIEQSILAGFILFLLAALGALGYLHITRESVPTPREGTRTAQETKSLLPPPSQKSEPGPASVPAPAPAPPKAPEFPKPEMPLAPAPVAQPPSVVQETAPAKAPTTSAENILITTPRDATGKPGEFCTESTMLPYRCAEGTTPRIGCWCPDGKSFLFGVRKKGVAQHFFDDKTMFLMTVDGARVSPSFLQDTLQLAFSPDGRTVAVVRASGIALVDLETRREQHCMPPTSSSRRFTFDGHRICYIALRNCQDVFVANTDGTGEERVSFTARAAVSVCTSPKENLVGYSSAHNNGFWIQRIDGDKAVILKTAELFWPEWHRDGEMISYKGEGLQFWVMDTTGKAKLRFTDEHAHLSPWHSWSPDGTKL